MHLDINGNVTEESRLTGKANFGFNRHLGSTMLFEKKSSILLGVLGGGLGCEVIAIRSSAILRVADARL